MPNKLDPIGKSSLGLDENIAALLCWLFPPVASLIFFFAEKDSKYAKFNGMQSTLLFAAVFVLNTILGITLILTLLVPIVLLAYGVLTIIFMIKSYKGEWIDLPIIGKFSMEQVEKQK